jgi:hypothetical protein
MLQTEIFELHVYSYMVRVFDRGLLGREDERERDDDTRTTGMSTLAFGSSYLS